MTEPINDNLGFIQRYNLEVPYEWMKEFHAGKEYIELPEGIYDSIPTNQPLVFNNEALGRHMGNGVVKKISGKKASSVYQVSPKGFEQMFALDVMTDPSVQLVFVHGIAGSGKTFLASAAGLEQIDGKLSCSGQYSQVVLLRPISYVGRSMGLVPGDAEEKYYNFVAPVLSHIESLAPQKLDWLINEGKLIAQPIEYIRGAEFKNAIVILDEAQNTGIHEMTTILTRLHHTSKLIVCGDTHQVDERGEMKTRNGLTVAMEVMQGGKDADVAVVEFFKSERKGISLKAATRMPAS